MIQSIYLHKEIVQVLQCYGKLEDVINRILVEARDGKIDVMDKPPCPDRKGATRYNINITEESYLELLEEFTPYSTRISIRRLLYWFVENGIYDMLGWKQTSYYKDYRKELIHKRTNICITELNKCKKYITCKEQLDKIDDIQQQIRGLVQDYDRKYT